MLDETGREMHGSWGNMIEAEDAFERMGADVMRWQFCAQPPDRNLLFGFGPDAEIQRKLLTLWNSARFLADYGRIEHFQPEWGAEPSRRDLRPLDHWLLERTNALVREATDGYEAYLTVDVMRAFEAFVDDLSNWYIRRSRRRFWDGDQTALQRSGLHSCNRSALSRRSCRSSPSISGMRSCAMLPETRRSPSTSRAGRRRRRPTKTCSRRSPRCAASSRAATRPALRQVSSCASRCGASSSRAPRSRAGTWTSSARSCA